MAATVPSTPASPTKLSADLTQITIQWTAPADNGGTPITGYIVLWDVGSGGTSFQQVFSCDKNTLTYTRGGLSPYSG